MSVFLMKKFAAIIIGLMFFACLGFSSGTNRIAYAQAELTYKKYLYGTTSRGCGYPGYRFDMNKIFETAKKYPNPEIIIVTPQERRQIEKEIRDWNMQGRQPRLGMDPCSTCSSEYEACVVYKIFEGGVVDETRKPLEGGVKYNEPDGGETRPPVKGRVEQSGGICERYGADINPFEGRLHVVPKTAQGSRYYCWVSFPNWRLLGEDGNYCCYFAPNEWVIKVPPIPGKPTPSPRQDRRPPKSPWDGPFPWEQPAQAQSPSDLADFFALTVVWEEPVKELREDSKGYSYNLEIQREGKCEIEIEFYANGRAKFKKFTYRNEDKYHYTPNRREVEIIEGSAPNYEFNSKLTINPRGNGLYDIFWTTPRLKAYEERKSLVNVEGRWYEQPQPGGQDQDYWARCIGQVFNESDPKSGINYQLLGVRLQGNRLPILVKTKILKELEKQAPKATVMAYWNFKQPRITR